MKRKEHKSAAFDTVDMTSATVLWVMQFSTKGYEIKMFCTNSKKCKKPKTNV